jgi:hypothetical protein
LLSHERKKGKIKSLETVLWMAIWGCGSPACCCQPAVAGGFIYADLRSELNTHLAPQGLFTLSSPGHQCYCFTSFPLSKHTGGGDSATSFLRPVYLELTWEVGLLPLSCGIFFPSPLLQGFPLLIAGHVPSLLLCGRLVYLQLKWEVGPPPSLAEFSLHHHC